VFRVHKHVNLVNNVVQNSISPHAWALGAIVPCYDDLRLYILDALQEDEPAPAGEMLINGTDPATEHAVYRNAQCRSFPVHRSTAAYHEIGMPNQIEAIHHSVGNEHRPTPE